MNSTPVAFPPPNSISSKFKKSNKNAIKSIKSNRIIPLPTKMEKDNDMPTSSAVSFVPDESICDGRCLAERRIHCREMAKWGRQVLTLVGLENVLQRAIGAKHWRRFNRSIKKSIANPSNFIANEQQNCNWCFSQRVGAIGHEACPTMNETLLKGEIVEGDNKMLNDDHLIHNGNNSSSSPRIASSISADSSSTASSPSSVLPFLPPASKLFLPFYFNPTSGVGPLQSNGHCSPSKTLLRQSASTTRLASPPSSSKANNAESKANSVNSNSNSPLADSSFARFFSMQQNSQNQAQLSPTTAAAERMAITTAAMQFMSAMAAGNGIGQNIGNSPFLASLFPSAGLYPPYWPFCTAPMGQHFSALLAQQNYQNGSSTGGNNEGGVNQPTSPSENSPANPFANFELHQQFALAWQSQMMAAFGLLGGTLNGTTTNNNNTGTPSEDEALAFLFGQRQQKTPPKNGQQNDSGKKATNGGGDEQPLDLSAKSGLKWPRAKERGIKRKIEMEEAPKLIKNESSELLQQYEEEFDGIEENFLEDGSEAESPKLGTKKTYTQAKLDAADIRLGRLGTRRASCVYGIPRSTLRNKIYKLTEKGGAMVGGGGGSGENGVKRRRLRALGMEESHKNEQNLEKDMEMAEDSLKLNAVPEEGNAIGKETKMQEDEEEGISQNNLNGQNSTKQQNEYLPMTEGSFASTAQKLFKQLSGQIGQFVGQLQQEPKRKIQKMEKWERASQNDGKESSKSPMELLDKNNKEKDNNNKGHRPKRGQYRKYEKDALDKAVAAVRNGEMSVHRAGSHFGVPHSTLEYKVKERNLLRTKSKKQLLTFNSSGAIQISSSSSPNVHLPSTINSPKTNSTTSSPPPYSPTTEEARIVLTKMLNSIVGENQFNN